ncbi:hypothetical protein Bca52824_023714 [Brassica carinata]|uniref:Uncharacterized protein n=1 Tax=Brassica carinata TaxID=52824 RepID=A0A8X8AUS9_BRACI|nr:hypothetical protein Bca52824_023714 [Brassica carinata]
MIEPEPTEERMQKSETSHLVVPKHLRPPICAEAVGTNKRAKRIHDPVKIMVPCAITDVELPIQPDRSMQLGSYSGVFDDPLHAEASQRGLIFRIDVDTGPTDAIPNNISKPALIDTTNSSSIDTNRVSEHNEFETTYMREAVGTNKERRGYMICEDYGSCAITDVELPIQPDRSMQLGSYSGVFDDPLHAKLLERVDI